MRVCLQELLCAPEVSVDYTEPVLHLFLSVYIRASAPGSVCLQEPCCICALLSTRALFCICACLQSTKVLCCTWMCLPPRVQCRLYLEEQSLQIFFVSFGYFRNRFVCFSCFNTCSKHRYKPKIIFLVSQKKTETDCVSVQTESIFCLFRGHPTQK
jgi:hypothetical protein